jgi:SAM-dependent methyltransferase
MRSLWSSFRKQLRSRIGTMLPPRLRDYLRHHFPRDRNAPPVGHVRWGDLRRTSPISRHFGSDRGTSLDRHYIESFLSAQSSDIVGRVLEVKDSSYTRRFGGMHVTHSDVLDIDPQNPHATIIADLNAARELPNEAFDCIILTQTLQYVYNVRSAIRELHRSLKPSGVLLVTVPGITQIHLSLLETWYWTFTSSSMQQLFKELFPASHLTVEAHGNVLSATAFLQGISVEELSLEELSVCDPEYQLVVTVRAVKPKT